MNEIQFRIGQRIREKRKEKKMTAEELATKLDVTKSYMSKVENGKTKTSVEFLNKVSEILKVPIGYFLDDTKIEPGEELREKGVEWIYFGKEVEEEGLTIDELRRIVKVYLSKE